METVRGKPRFICDYFLKRFEFVVFEKLQSVFLFHLGVTLVLPESLHAAESRIYHIMCVRIKKNVIPKTSLEGSFIITGEKKRQARRVNVATTPGRRNVG